MSQYYRGKRVKENSYYRPGQPFRLSRSMIESFMGCQRCFYIDRRRGVGTPPGFPFAINSKVDAQVKAEFDGYRDLGETPPVLAGFDVRPAYHDKLNAWRNNFKGVTRQFENLEIFGAIDDIWVDTTGMYAPADYKATANKEIVETIDPETKPHHKSYVRQMDIYGWLLDAHVPLSGLGYWLYFTASDQNATGSTITFTARVIPRTLDTSWVEPTLAELLQCLDSDAMPESGADCDVCLHHRLVAEEIA
jgi:hypothetical protein